MIYVTIMIPTYNQELYIQEAIHSALSQTYPFLEVIVCDDASNDETFTLASSIVDPRLKVYQNDQNLGRVANYHKLLYELALGDYVINLDGDDYFTDTAYIEKAVALIKQFGVDLVFSNQLIAYKSHIKASHMQLPSVMEGNWLFLNFQQNGIHIPHMSALYNRHKAMLQNFYSYDAISSDWESLLRFIVGKRVGFIETPCGAWRQLAQSESKTPNIQKLLENVRFVNSVVVAVRSYFDDQILAQWQQRVRKNLVLGFQPCVIYSHLSTINTFLKQECSLKERLAILLHYKFFIKWLLGFKEKICAE